MCFVFVCGFSSSSLLRFSALFTSLTTQSSDNKKPPSRTVVYQLHEASDKNQSGGIDKKEFATIVSVCCAQILSRMLVYYSVLILLVPYVAQYVVDFLHVTRDSYMEMATEQLVSTSMFFLAIPVLWNYIDQESEKAAVLAKTEDDDSKDDTIKGPKND